MPNAPKPSEAALAAHAAHRANLAEARQYLVVGPRAVEGKCKGETVELTLTPGQEAALVQAGHIVRLDDVRLPEDKTPVEKASAKTRANHARDRKE